MIHEAIEIYIESLVARGDPIPGPVEIERVPSLRDPRPSAVTPHPRSTECAMEAQTGQSANTVKLDG